MRKPLLILASLVAVALFIADMRTDHADAKPAEYNPVSAEPTEPTADVSAQAAAIEALTKAAERINAAADRLAAKAETAENVKAIEKDAMGRPTSGPCNVPFRNARGKWEAVSNRGAILHLETVNGVETWVSGQFNPVGTSTWSNEPPAPVAASGGKQCNGTACAR